MLETACLYCQRLAFLLLQTVKGNSADDKVCQLSLFRIFVETVHKSINLCVMRRRTFMCNAGEKHICVMPEKNIYV